MNANILRVLSWVLPLGLMVGVSACDSALFSDPPSALEIEVSSGPSATPGSSSLVLTWKTNQAAYSLVEYGTVSGTYPSSTMLTSEPETSHSATLTGLSDSTTYYYRLRFIGENGTEYFSKQYSATAGGTEPTLTTKLRGVWLIGGISGAGIGSTVASVDLYDPVTDTWYATVTSLPVPVSFAGYAAYDGKLFVIGGFNASGTALSDVQIYTIATNTWSTGASITAGARANISATVIYDKIYILGGTAGLAATATLTPVPVTTGAVNAYSPSGNSWTSPTTSLTAVVSDRFVYSLHDTIYHLGGRSAQTTISTYAHDGYVTTPAAGGLTTATEVTMPTLRTGVAGSLYAPSSGPPVLILVGGISALTASATFINGASPSAGTLQNLVNYIPYPFVLPQAWAAPTTTTTYPLTIAFGAAVMSTVVSPARFYHFGGSTALGTSAAGSAAAYWVNPPAPPAAWSIASWTATPNLPTGRWGHGAVTLNQQ